HVLDRILRELDLDAALRLVLLDRLEQGVVLGLVEALDPPDGELLLRQRLAGEGERTAGDDAGEQLPHRGSPWFDRGRPGPRVENIPDGVAVLNPGMAKLSGRLRAPASAAPPAL